MIVQLQKGTELVHPVTTTEAVKNSSGTALESLLDSKITNPASGSAGQVLTKTEDGSEWSTVQGGMTDDEKLITAAAFDDLDERLVSVEYGWEKRESGVVRTIVNSDVTDNLTSPYKQKPLSANQGVVLKKKADEDRETLAAALCDLKLDKLPATVIAPAYDAHSTYNVGDYRTINNGLYKCSVAITTPEFFNPEHWTATTVMQELVTT